MASSEHEFGKLNLFKYHDPMAYEWNAYNFVALREHLNRKPRVSRVKRGQQTRFC
jgi:hypothetical protein